MKFLTEESLIICDHVLGVVNNKPGQDLVKIAGKRLLVENDPEGRSIAHCPNININMKPCQTTLRVDQGYSTFIRVMGKRVCLDPITGFTDGTPPGIVKYKVRDPKQDLVAEKA